MLSMQTTEKLVPINTNESINPKMLAESLNPNDGRMSDIKKVTYDNLYVGAEVRDLTVHPPIMGFVTSIEEYGWSMYDDNAYSFSYYFHVINCDGRIIEFDLEEVIISPTLYIVVREK